jgi:hypothetical protein
MPFARVENQYVVEAGRDVVDGSFWSIDVLAVES